MIDYKPTDSGGPGEAGKSPRTRSKSFVIRVIIIAAALFLLVLLPAGGAAAYYFYNNHLYSQAETNIKQHEYSAAIDDLAKTAASFRDSRKLTLYAQAGQALQAKDFAGAKRLFTSLAGFRDSGLMATETDYRHAQSLLAQQSFDEARELLETLGAYKDSKSLLKEADYQKAAFLLSKGDIQSAKALFASLGDYKDSALMVTEADYREAAGLLQSGQYSQAESMFAELAGKNYKDAATMLLEAKYGNAKVLYQNGQYLDALKKLREVGLYKDSNALADEMCKAVYDEGIEFYRNADFADARYDFNAIPPSFGRTQDYLLLIAAHGKSAGDAYEDAAAMRKIYNKLKALGSFEDADDLRTSDAFIYFRLEGDWKGGGYEFSLYYDAKQNGWIISYSLPTITGQYFEITDGVLVLGSDDKGWKRDFRFTFLSEDKVQIYCYKNGKTYTMTR